MPNQGGTHEQHVKAGQQSHKDAGDRQERQAAPGGKDDGQHHGGSGNFAEDRLAEDRGRAAEAGRKSGKH